METDCRQEGQKKIEYFRFLDLIALTFIDSTSFYYFYEHL